MTSFDLYADRIPSSPAMRERRRWLAWIRDVASGALTLVAFLAVAFTALYLRARLGLPS